MLTQNLLKECLHYDPETGIFVWLKSANKRVHIGSIAGTINHDGYRRIKLQGKIYSAHRLAFLYMNGSFPPEETDHINGVRDDNRFSNLRLATSSENMCNRGKQVDNTSGFKGVIWNKRDKKWRAQIMQMNRRVYLGHFDSPEAAHQAYVEAAKRLHGDFANFGK